jgi:RNA polymerase sigma factor (sigma-70 family)
MKATAFPFCTVAFSGDKMLNSALWTGQRNDGGASRLPSVAILYKDYAPALLRLILKIVKRDEIAQDVLQETFVKIWKSSTKYEEVKGRPYTWMARLATNTAIDHLRLKGELRSIQNKELTIVFEERETKLMYHFNPDTIGLRELTESLTESQRLVLDRVYFKGYTHVEAADELGMSLGTVKSKVKSALLALRKMFVAA